MRIKAFLSSRQWIISAIIYPMSWVTYSGLNLSFLAWIAFVPLFVHLKNHHESFMRFYGPSVAVILSWAVLSAGWLFHFPNPLWKVAIAFFGDILHISAPFLFLFFMQKKLGFRHSLVLFPFLWTAWEWLYIPWEHTMGTHLLAYGQGNNLWLIQMVDIGGVWIVSFWVILFNVVIYFALEKVNFNYKSKQFAISVLKRMSWLIIPSFLYSAYAFQKLEAEDTKSIQVSIIPTQFDADYLGNEKNQKAIIEETLHRTDSLAFDLIEKDRRSDLYVWPEAGTSYWAGFPNITSILQQATNDWEGTLLTGCKGIPIQGEDRLAHISAVMVSPSLDSIHLSRPLQYHHKTILSPGGEAIPYKHLILPLLSEDLQYATFFEAGRSFEPLQIETRNGESFKTGLSLCYEQWFPLVWTKTSQKGAEFFVHMAAEGWYGDYGFAQFMANVTRFRAIENRKAVVRSSNKGLSLIIDNQGIFREKVSYGSLEIKTAEVQTSTKITWFSKYPNTIPIGCLITLISSFLFRLMKLKKSNL